MDKHWFCILIMDSLCIHQSSGYTGRSAYQVTAEWTGSLLCIHPTKYIYIKSTTVYVPSSELGPPRPLSPCECVPPPRIKGGGGHTSLRGEGWGSPNSDDWRKSLALCLTCDSPSRIHVQKDGIHESTISLRLLDIILTFLRLLRLQPSFLPFYNMLFMN